MGKKREREGGRKREGGGEREREREREREKAEIELPLIKDTKIGIMSLLRQEGRRGCPEEDEESLMSPRATAVQTTTMIVGYLTTQRDTHPTHPTHCTQLTVNTNLWCFLQ